MRIVIFFVFVLLLIFGSTVLYAQNTPEYTSVQQKLATLGFEIPTQNVMAIDFTLKDLKGNDISLSSLQGKFVFLNFWATWCPPCRAEMSSMEILHKKYKRKDFTILAVNLQESNTRVQKFLKENKYSFPVVLDSNGQVGSGMYGVSGIPTTYFIGKEGQIIARLVGTREWDTREIYDIIDELVN